MLLKTPAATGAFGRRILKTAPAHVWLLRGNLGAGKTTLVRAVLRSLGVTSAVTSPTFGLVRRYRLKKQPWAWAVHIDAYRIKDKSEVAALEIAEMASNHNVLLLIEWPERLPGMRWGQHVLVVITHRGHSRQAKVALRSR